MGQQRTRQMGHTIWRHPSGDLAGGAAVVLIQQLAGLGYVALFVSRLVEIQIARQLSSPAAAVTPTSDERSGQ